LPRVVVLLCVCTVCVCCRRSCVVVVCRRVVRGRWWVCRWVRRWMVLLLVLLLMLMVLGMNVVGMDGMCVRRMSGTNCVTVVRMLPHRRRRGPGLGQ